MTKMNKLAVLASDDASLIEQINKIIAAYHYSILQAKSALSSILKILEKSVDILIVDLDLRQNNSLDLIKIIKKMRPRLPIIVLSEDFSLDTIRAFIESGVFYCAMKPIQRSELEKVLQALNRYHKKYNNVSSLV